MKLKCLVEVILDVPDSVVEKVLKASDETDVGDLSLGHFGDLTLVPDTPNGGTVVGYTTLDLEKEE